MKKYNAIDEAFGPLSKWIVKAFFNKRYDRIWSQKIEDEHGIPKDKFHAFLVRTGLLGVLIYINSRK